MSWTTAPYSSTPLEIVRRMMRIHPLELNMHLLRMLRIYLKLKLKMPAPLFVALDITYKCNLDCFFCYRQAFYHDKVNKNLELSEAKTVVDNLADADVMVLGIAGGEPLLRNDLEDLGKYAKDKGLIVALTTNGTLVTRSRAQRLLNSFHSITVSLDGLADNHDRIRGKIGTYDEAIQGLKYLTTNPRTCAISVNFVLNKFNFQELRKVCDIVKNIGVDFFFIEPVSGSRSWVIPEDAIKRSIGQILELHYQHHISQSYYFINHIFDYITGTVPKLCDAGRLYLAVNNEGKLFLCPGLPRTKETYIGSLLQHSMVDLLKSNKLKKVKDAIVPKCSPCLKGCTTEFSLLAKSPLKTILSKYGGFRRKQRSERKLRAGWESWNFLHRGDGR